MQLECIARYQSATRTVEPGHVLDLSEAEAQQLLADSPGSWHIVPTAAADEKALDDPPADKMVKRPARSK